MDDFSETTSTSADIVIEFETSQDGVDTLPSVASAEKAEIVNETSEASTASSSIDMEKYVTIKFYAPYEYLSFCTYSFHGYFCIGNVRTELARHLKIPLENLILSFRDEILDDETLLYELKGDLFGVLDFYVSSTNPRDVFVIEDTHIEPDIITVRVPTLTEGIKDVVVEVYNEPIEKPFLGGFVDRRTGYEYRHGYSQTGPRRPKIPPELLRHRDTQTVFVRHRRTEQKYEHATQMTNNDIWIPNVTDRIITAGPYETADEREIRIDIEGKVRTIQRYYWAWRMKRALKELSAEYKKRIQLANEREAREVRYEQNRRKRDLISRVFPRTAADFSMLYAMTERWKKAEIARIVSMHCGPARIAEFYLLLEKEIDILRSIEALRLKLKKDRKIQRQIDFFKTIGEPIIFNSIYDHRPIEMDTLETQKGRDYHDLFVSIANRRLSRDERLASLVALKALLADHNYCQLTQELIVLIDRASEMLARGFCEQHIDTLQERIEALLLHHFELEECNEGVTRRGTRLLERKMRGNVYFCQGCHKLKSIEAFAINVRMREVKVCAACKFIDKAREPWVDISPYRFMLRQIRRNEHLLRAKSSLAFILQERDIHFIVTHIWHGHAAMSECDDIYRLRLVRWDKKREWSPWNCILLTEEAAKCHLKIRKLEDVYDKGFRSDVFNKHALAKSHFSASLDVERCMKRHADEFVEEEEDKKSSCLHLSDEEEEKEAEQVE